MHGNRLLAVIWLFTLAVAPIGSAAVAKTSKATTPSRLPDVDFKLGIRRVEEGRTDPAVYILRLTCLKGVCGLGTMALNECSKSPQSGNASFYPSYDLKSTGSGNLRVTRSGDVLVVEERGSDLGGDYVTTLRFGMEKRPWGDLALTSFSGAFVKNSVLLGQVITAQFIPFPDHTEVALDCPLRIPGLEPSLSMQK